MDILLTRAGKKAVARKATSSGAVGGPSTGAGLNYQIDYAVFRLLQLFPQVLSFPVLNHSVRIEPRVPLKDADIRWDLGFDEPKELAEAKLNPTKEDFTEWIHRSASQAVLDTAKFSLVCNKSTSARMVAFKQLQRIAVESGDDRPRFNALVELEEVPFAEELLAELGDRPLELLQRLRVVDLPDHVLYEQIKFRCDLLAEGGGSQNLRDLLFERVARAVPRRTTLFVRDLIQEATNQGIRLKSVPSVDISGFSAELREAFLVLGECQTAVPVEILADMTRTTADGLGKQLEDSGVANAMVVNDGMWSLAPLPVPLPHADPELCARALRALLAFVESNKYSGPGRQQVRNVVTLAKACATAHPEAVARLFITVDKPLKSLGDKHLVLEVAELTISAARKAPSRGRPETEGEAQALICGKSWALQRLGRLDEAKIFAEKSLGLGEDIGWDRNTAYCEKCIGRLYRIMAEAENDPQTKASLLKTSKAQIETAVERFSQSAEFGALHPEVGDCYSLLGRTHLVAGDLSAARDCVEKAKSLISDSDGKDYFDLLILEGELLESRDRAAAEARYVEALEHEGADDFERSEIAARAYFRRAANRSAMGNKGLAIRDFQKAQDLWGRLGEPDNAARANWERLRLEDAVPSSATKPLSLESFSVRVKVLVLHQQRVAQFSGKRVARRVEPGSEYWKQLIKEARSLVAVELIQ